MSSSQSKYADQRIAAGRWQGFINFSLGKLFGSSLLLRKGGAAVWVALFVALRYDLRPTIV